MSNTVKTIVKTMSIKRKILSVILGMSFVSLAAFCVAVLIGLFSIRDQVQFSSAQLGEHAASKSSSFLEREALDKLLTKAQDRSALVNERLLIIAKDAVFFSDYAAELYKNAANLRPVRIPFPSSKNFGELTLQLRSANGRADYPRIQREAGILGNISSAYLSNASDMGTMTVALFLGTESGFIISFDRYSSDERQVFDPRTRPWYIGAKESGGTYWTAPYNDERSGKYVVTCSHPIFGADGKIRGVTGIDVVIEDLDDEIVNIGVGKYGYAFIVGKDGSLISSRGFMRQSTDVLQKKSAYLEGYSEYNSVIERMTNGETGFERVKTESGDKYMAFAPISVTGWGLAIVQPVSEIMELVAENSAAIEKMAQDTRGFMNTLIMAAFGVFAIVFAAAGVAIVYFSGKLSEKITRPIVKLEEYLGKIANGNLDTQIEIKTGDEIERLGECVNIMAHDLKDYMNNLQRVTGEKERIGAELNIARKIQTSMLPRTFPPFPDRPEFDIYALMQPAKEVGGDFYDFFFIDKETLAVVIADVSGKGVGAALFMVITKALIKSNAQAGKNPEEVFETVNNLLCESNDTGMFVTVFMGYLNTATGKFSYVNAGHTKPLLCVTDKFDFLHVKPGFILGGVENMRFLQGEINLKKGDTVFLYTDGITEAVNVYDKTMFGNARLIDTANDVADLPPFEFTTSIKKTLDDFSRGTEQSDDITMLVLRYNGNAGESAIVARENAARRETKTEHVTGEISVLAKLENLETVRRFVAEKLEHANVDAKTLNQVELVIEEIFVNIANYAYPSTEGDVTVRVSSNGGGVSLEFEDSGIPYNPLDKKEPDVTLNAEERPLGGLGVFMVKHLVREASYRRDNERNFLSASVQA